MPKTYSNCGFDENPNTASFCNACGCDLLNITSIAQGSSDLNIKYNPTINIKLNSCLYEA